MLIRVIPHTEGLCTEYRLRPIYKDTRHIDLINFIRCVLVDQIELWLTRGIGFTVVSGSYRKRSSPACHSK